MPLIESKIFIKKSKIIIISFFNNFDIKNMPILIYVLLLSPKKIDIEIISSNTYCMIYKLKKT